MKRFQILITISKLYILLSTLLRLIFIVWQFSEIDISIINLLKTGIYGFVFDIGVVSYFCTIFGCYFLILPSKFVGKKLDKIIVYAITCLLMLIFTFTFFAELSFWDEFKSRFNFIAVDYLIYTYEVIQNINQSYPLYILIPTMLLLSGITLYFLRKNALPATFTTTSKLRERVLPYGISLLVTIIFTSFITNADAEWSKNRYNSEISKSGIYSFFAAMRNNQMEYDVFYDTLNINKAFKLVHKNLYTKNTTFTPDALAIKRNITQNSPAEIKPNVVVILMESMSASFMTEFGNKEKITPNLDKLSKESVYFSNLFATGTRTVRGMEAMSLCIPPTPGSSIVKRLNNQNLFTISSVFKSKGYQSNFFYGGDGYFDNMNSYFGGNGFNIYDRGRGSVLNDEIKTTRTNINDNEVQFENAWGICDEDIYNKMLLSADTNHKNNKPFFNFIMTTSNHKPYTYPNKKIWVPSGAGRSGAVMYADYALGEFLKNATKKPWFKNTVFVIVADHCASSAGKDEIDVANYHIPAFIYSSLIAAKKVNAMCSQIDVMPTLFSLLNWNYTSNFFGKNVLDANFEERAFIGTYLKLGLLKKDKIMILSNQKKSNFYKWNKKNNRLKPLPLDKAFLDETISFYQTADYLFVNNKLK
jgi:phosphoglycerol transferase MdoB-like AlkP superfamily enzyme